MAYSDTYMQYDTAKHRYILTMTYCSERLNVDLMGRINSVGAIDRSQAAQLLLERASSVIYSYIYSIGMDNTAQEYVLGTDAQAREIVMEAMGEQVYYMLINGDLGLASGVDAANSTGAGQKIFWEARVSPNAKSLLERNLTAYNVPIIYMGKFPISIYKRRQLPAYKEENY